jgi:hypothetical protein
MPYKLAADFVVLIHFLWIMFLISGALVGVRYKLFKIVHIAGLGFALLIQILGWFCPLTHLEIWLRQKHDPSLSYTGSFIIHYVEKIIYIELSPTIIFLFTLALCIFTMYIYLRKARIKGELICRGR